MDSRLVNILKGPKAWKGTKLPPTTEGGKKNILYDTHESVIQYCMKRMHPGLYMRHAEIKGKKKIEAFKDK